MGNFKEIYQLLVKQDSGKTYSVQKLGLYNFWGKIIKTEWITSAEIDD